MEGIHERLAQFIAAQERELALLKAIEAAGGIIRPARSLYVGEKGVEISFSVWLAFPDEEPSPPPAGGRP